MQHFLRFGHVIIREEFKVKLKIKIKMKSKKYQKEILLNKKVEQIPLRMAS
jgi:hypothetical protein